MSKRDAGGESRVSARATAGCLLPVLGRRRAPGGDRLRGRKQTGGDVRDSGAGPTNCAGTGSQAAELFSFQQTDPRFGQILASCLKTTLAELGKR